MQDRGVVLSPMSTSTNPSIKHLTRLQACLCVSFLPHPAKHIKHVHLGVFMCSLPPSPCWTCKTCLSGRVYMFATSLTCPLIHERHAQTGVSMCCFHFDTMRACPPHHVCHHFNSDTVRKGIPLLVVLLFQCGEEGSDPPCHLKQWG